MSTSWATAARQVPGLDHDPCPGDVPGVRRLAEGLRERADHLGHAVSACRGWDAAGWRGPAADEAQVAMTGLADRLATLRRSFSDGAGALDGWAGELDRLQDEAAALGEQALDNRRQRLAATVRVTPAVAGVVLGDDLELGRLEDERRAIQHRAEDLHLRWLGDSRRCSAVLDAAAPPTPSGWWRGTWDLGHDHYQLAVRSGARVLGWSAEALGVASTLSGVAALHPVAAPVAVPLSIGLAATATQVNAHLAVGAGASGDAVVVGVATVGAGAAAAGAVRATAAGTAAAQRAARVSAAAADGAVLGTGTRQLIQAVLGRDGPVRPRTVTDLDGEAVPVTVHDVAQPWHVGYGLSGAGFAGVATVPVPTPPPGGRVVAPPPRTHTPISHRTPPNGPGAGQATAPSPSTAG